MFSKIKVKSEIVKSVMVLSSGTVIAQGVSYLLMPIITRLFTPEDFGEFGILMKVVGFIAVIGAASYEFAIPLPKNRNHAFHLYRLALRILVWVLGGTLLLGLGYWGIEDRTNRLLFYVVIGTLIAGFTIFYSIGRYWAIRSKKFKQISYAGLMNSGATNVGKLLTGLAGMGVVGLALSTFIGLVVGSVLYFIDGVHLFREKSLHHSGLREKVMARKYQDFPKVDLPHNIINAVRELLVAFFLFSFIDATFYGSFDHSFRMLKIPLLLVGASIGQVLYGKFAENFAHHQPIYPLLKMTVFYLIIGGIIPFIIIYFFGSPIFSFVFGEKWKLSGELAALIAPWLFANFVASTVSIVPAIIGKLKWFFWVSLVTTVLQLSCFALYPYLVTEMKMDISSYFAGISWLMFLLFFVTVFWMLKLVKNTEIKRIK